MAQRRSAQLAVAFSPTFKRQTTWDTPLAIGELTHAFPATSRNFVETDETTEDVFDCTGEDLLVERVTGRFSRLILDFEVDPQLLAGWLAFLYGVSAAPSGGTNELQTITGTASGGTAQIRFTHNYNMQLSAALDFDASAAEIQAALDAMPNIGAGNSVVAGGPLGTAPVTVTFQGALTNQPLTALEIVSALTGGTWSVARTTPGVGRTHNISRLGNGLYTLPFTTLAIGYRGSSRVARILKNVVVGDVRCRGASREVVTATVTLFMSADHPDATGLVLPACMDIEPIRFGDCDAILEGESLFATAGARWGNGSGIAPWRDFEYYMTNDVLTGAHAFTGQGIDVGRLERADRRPSNINLGVLGEPGDPLYEAAHNTSPRYVTSLNLRLGPASENVLVRVPQGILKLDSPPIRHEGDAVESHIRAIMRPKKVSGDGTTPSNVQAIVPQASAFLIAA